MNFVGYAEMVDRLILEISGFYRMGSSPIIPTYFLFSVFNLFGAYVKIGKLENS